jgi:hypothetical protein
MRQVLDNDEYQRQNETRYADLLHTDNQSTAADSFGRSDAASPQMFHHRGREAASNASSGRFYDWPESESSRGGYSHVGDDMSRNSQRAHNSILSIIAVNCLPGSYSAATNSESRRRKSYLPALLLTLILYGTVSIMLDVFNSISSLQKSRAMEQSQSDRFPGGFVGVTGQHSTSILDTPTSNGGVKVSMIQTRSFDLNTEIDEPLKQSIIDKNNPTMSDVPYLTEQILSTTFQHVLEYNKHQAPYENEVPLFWTFGTTSDYVFKSMLGCFPNVAQASGGYIVGTANEEAMRKFPSDIKMLQQSTTLGDDGVVVDAGKYANVDLFTADGVKRAADLNLMFPSIMYPLIHDHNYSELASDRTMTEAANDNSTNVQASQQIQLVVSPFLPEVVNGLFTPVSNNAKSPLPKCKVHSILLPTGHRIRNAYYLYTTTGGTGTFLEFITSPSIFVNNYVTRILSGQWDEGSPVTEVHLEIAKNVASRKIHMWPNRGVQDMVAFWAEVYRWQDGAIRHREQLIQQLQNQQQTIQDNSMVFGLECVFPPPDPNLPPPAHAPPPAPTDLEVEINRILAERNALDDQLFQYVVQLYDSWMS